MRYIITNVLIWFAVFIPLSFIDINYNGVNWEYSLAYGALIPFALWSFRHDPKTLLCLSVGGGCWFLGRLIELGSSPHEMEAWIRSIIVLCLVCLWMGRYRLLAISVSILTYSLHLNTIEATWAQQGLLNLLVASFFLIPARMESTHYASRAELKEQEHKKAA